VEARHSWKVTLAWGIWITLHKTLLLFR